MCRMFEADLWIDFLPTPTLSTHTLPCIRARTDKAIGARAVQKSERKADVSRTLHVLQTPVLCTYGHMRPHTRSPWLEQSELFTIC